MTRAEHEDVGAGAFAEPMPGGQSHLLTLAGVVQKARAQPPALSKARY
ncbi:MAG: hypothetical protein ACRDST_04430 [Pseudonocardiaceae bacterium]